MKDLDEFLKNIRPFAPGVADPTAYEWIRQAAITFCERTRLWRYEDTITITGDNPETVVTPDGAVIHEIERLDFNGAELDEVTPARLDELMAEWRAGTLTGTPGYYTQIAPNTVSLAPIEAGDLGVYMWLKPSQDATELPDFMPDQYRQVIADGALGRILLIPNQSFTNPEMAMAFAASFQSNIDSLSCKGFTGQQRAKQRTRASFY